MFIAWVIDHVIDFRPSHNPVIDLYGEARYHYLGPPMLTIDVLSPPESDFGEKIIRAPILVLFGNEPTELHCLLGIGTTSSFLKQPSVKKIVRINIEAYRELDGIKFPTDPREYMEFRTIIPAPKEVEDIIIAMHALEGSCFY